MRGDDLHQTEMFSYISLEQRVPKDHPLRPMRKMVDEILVGLSPQFEKLYSKTGRPSIPPEKLLRALLLQVLYSVRSERLLIEELVYNLLFRWFVGLNMDDGVWDSTTFTKNRDRLLKGDIAEAFFEQVLEQARGYGLLSDEHFTVDGTLIEAAAGLKSFKRKGSRDETPPDDPGKSHGELPRRETFQPYASIDDRSRRFVEQERKGKGSKAQLLRASAYGEPKWTRYRRQRHAGDWDGRARCGCCVRQQNRPWAQSDDGGRQGLRYEGVCRGGSPGKCDAACCSEQPSKTVCYRPANDQARRLRSQPKEAEKNRRDLWLGEDCGVAAEAAPPRRCKGQLGIQVYGRGL